VNPLSAEIVERIRRVKLAVFDVDGVMTDGSLNYGADGETTKVFNTLDGQGMKMLQQSGVDIAVISGRRSQALARRCSDLGIAQLQAGVEDKGHAFAELLGRLQLDASEAAGIGDDLVDLPILLRCGFAAAVPTAPMDVQNRVHYITRAVGGQGAAREFCDLIMHTQGTYPAALAKYLE
jgi:3-deoxy-D-manno-octulosonate 8-phosphate phosphatase (KDO 8-P phosphatase)